MKLREVLGIDFGGSGIKGAPVDTKTGMLLDERFRIPTPNPSTPESVAKTISEIVNHFNWKGGIGVGFPAVIQNGIVRTAANIDKSWIGKNANRLFSDVTKCPVIVVNDADAAGMAEMKWGAGKDNKGVVFLVTVGTGLGTVMFASRRLLPNLEWGHVFLPNGQEAETWASDATRKKLELSWEDWAKRFNDYLCYIEDLVWPDLIIIGGGVSKKLDNFAKYLTIKTKIVPASLMNEAGLIGAAIAAKKYFKYGI